MSPLTSRNPAEALAREVASLRREVRSASRGSQAAHRSIQMPDGQSVTLPEVAATGQAAQTAAVDAKQIAQAAQVDAETARANAVAATTVAQDAATKADDAEAAALQAAGIAAGKGKIVFSSSAPPGDASVLWIALPSNTPNRWDTATSRWVAISDAGIKAAADTAAAANTAAGLAAQAAQTAQNAASAAAGTAATALTTAQGKNTVTYSTEIPSVSTPGIRVHDVWFQMSPDTALVPGLITGTWEWDGDSWEPRYFGDAVLNSLTVGKLTSGVLNVSTKIVVGDPAGARLEFGGASGIQKFEADNTLSLDFGPGRVNRFAGQVSGISTAYAAGTTGWKIDADTGEANFTRLNVFNEVTAQAVNASQVSIAGRTIQEMLDDRPRGLVAQGFNNSLNLQGYVNDKAIAEISFTALPGRGYQILTDGPIYASSDANTAVGFDYRHTNDGSVPTVTSTLATFLGERLAGPNGSGQFPRNVLTHNFLWYPPIVNNAPTPIRLLLTFRRAWGSGTVGVDCTGPGRLQVYVIDVGPALPNSMVANGSQLAQPANTTTPPPPPPPPPAPQSFTETFYTTWGASYRADGSVWSINEQGWAYQGNDGFNGDQIGLVGFDLGYIRSRLAGSTIKSATFYARAGHTYNYSGGWMLLGSHGADTAPSTRDGIPVLKERRASAQIERGGWAGIECSGVMQEIRDSQASGFTFGRAGTLDRTYQTYFYQPPHADRPRVVITYEK